MEQYLASHEIRLTWLFFVSAFVLIGLGETFRPRKVLGNPTARRWAGNGLLALSDAAAQAVFPLGATLVAMMVRASPYGLLNRPNLPFAFRCLLALILLDLLRYAEHYLFHRIAWLWRIHRVHHSDPDFDLTTGVRNHPAEAMLLQGANLAAVALLAPPPAAVIGIGVATALHSLFSHANLHIPERWDAAIRPILFTPDLHRIHHSQEPAEQNSNLGFFFPWWDKLFGTYRDAPSAGHDRMRIGLEEFQDGRSLNVLHMLAMPFRGRAARQIE